MSDFKDIINTHQTEVRGFIIGGASGFISQPLFTDWVKPMLISIACAFVGLLVTHYGKKILAWIDKKLKL